MHKQIKLLLTTAIALAALAAAATTASAAEATIEPAGEATATSLGLLTFSSELFRISCTLTLGLSLHRVITKIAGNLIGYVTRVGMNCNEESVWRILERFEASNPATVMWHVSYQSILGTLPQNVTGILFLINGTAFLARLPIFTGADCLYEGNVGVLLAITGTNPYTSGLMRSLGETLLLKRGAALTSSFCLSSVRIIGSFSISPAQRILRT